MRITTEIKKNLVESFRKYLILEGLNPETIFLFFSEESFRNFISKFEPDITNHSSVVDKCKFLNENQYGLSVIVVWNPVGQKIGQGRNFVFSKFKFVWEEEKEGTHDFVHWGEDQTFLLKEK